MLVCERYSAERVNAARRRVLEVGLINGHRIDRILTEALQRVTTPEQPSWLQPG